MSETLSAWIARQTPALRLVARRVRPIVRAAFPDLVEGVDRFGVIRYARDARLNDWIAYISGHRDHLNLGFAYGAALPDPTRIVIGTGKRLRHIELRTVEDAERPAVRAVLMAAARLERSLAKTDARKPRRTDSVTSRGG
jgi:hypothetical protein